jgi:hypothetical protein
MRQSLTKTPRDKVWWRMTLARLQLLGAGLLCATLLCWGGLHRVTRVRDNEDLELINRR